MFSIVASDLDGTLLSPKYKITKYTKKIIRRLINTGIHFVFATGRHHIDVEQIKKKLKINSYMITSNGAKIHDPYGKLICSNNINKNIALDLLKIVYDDKSISTNIFKKNEWFINNNYFDKKKFFYSSSFKYKIYEKNLSPNEIYKVYYTSSNNNKLIILEKILNKKWGKKINVSFSKPTCLEVISGNTSKGQALSYVSNLLGLTINDCISFGDGMNDKEMLNMSGKGCIMNNAEKKLKKILQNIEIIGSNKDDAVPLYLKTMYNL